MRSYNSEGRNKWKKRNRKHLQEYKKSPRSKQTKAEYYRNNRQTFLTRVLRTALRRLGVTPHAYEEKLRLQEGRCAICRREPGRRRLSLDHCHKTGVFRGLLCTPCNTALGLLGEDPARLRVAEAYLLQHT